MTRRAALVGLGGFLMVAAGFLRWRRSGAGSSLTGLELAGVLRRSTLAPAWADWVAAGLVAVPVLGAVLVASVGTANAAIEICTSVAAAIVVAAMVVAAASGLLPPHDWAPGAVLATAGATAAAASGLAVDAGRVRR